jgi:hypothetical protein
VWLKSVFQLADNVERSAAVKIINNDIINVIVGDGAFEPDLLDLAKL